MDREERPDIDTVYMTAVNVLGQRGGWPLSMFLTADAKPIVGGTYWPPEDRKVDGDTMPGFKTVLNTVHKLQIEKAKLLGSQADDLAEATRREMANVARGVALVDLDLALGDAGLQRAARLLYGEDAELETISRAWQPYCSVASWYLWRHLDAAPAL